VGERRTAAASLAATALAAWVLAAAPASAAEAIRCFGAWVRPAQVGGADAVYLSIRNGSARPDVLESAASPAAASVTLHESRMVGAVMTMRALPSITVAAHGQVTLAPVGLHLMMLGVRRPLRLGDRLPIFLTFAHAGRVRVEAVVSTAPPPSPMRM
jgi:copper(I)-binding protein